MADHYAVPDGGECKVSQPMAVPGVDPRTIGLNKWSVWRLQGWLGSLMSARIAAVADHHERRVPGCPIAIFGFDLFVICCHLEYTISNADMDVHLLVQSGAEPVNESHCADMHRCPVHLRRTILSTARRAKARRPAGEVRLRSARSALPRRVLSCDVQRGRDVSGLRGAHEARYFLPVTQQHQRGPELDAVAAPKRATWSIFNLELAPLRILWQNLGQCRLDGAAMAAPVSAEFEQGQARQDIDFGTGRGFGFAEVGFGRAHARIVAQVPAKERRESGLVSCTMSR